MTGVYYNFSRLNHSCGPNSIRNINCSDTGEISVIATRDIEEGEEINIKVNFKSLNLNLIYYIYIFFSILTWNLHLCKEGQEK